MAALIKAYLVGFLKSIFKPDYSKSLETESTDSYAYRYALFPLQKR